MQVERLGGALWLVWWGARNLLPGAARESRRARAAQGAETGWWVQWVWFWEGSGASSRLVAMETCLSRNLKLWEEKGGTNTRQVNTVLFRMFSYRVMGLSAPVTICIICLNKMIANINKHCELFLACTYLIIEQQI